MLTSPIDRSRLKTLPRQELAEGLGVLVETMEKLEIWWSELPGEISPKEGHPQPPVTRPSVHLTLEYCLARMFAGRPFIFPKDSSSRSNNGSNSSPGILVPDQTGSRGKLHPRLILVRDCVEAALTAIDTLRQLRNSCGLARASYTEFSSCRAAVLVIITQCLQWKTNRLRNALKQGMSMIKEMAAGGESARSEASLIEAFESAIARLDASEEVESDYARFKQWEWLWKKEGSAFPQGPQSGSMPLPPQLSAESVTQALAGSVRHGGDVFDASAIQPCIGLDANIGRFLQPVDEFASLLGYESWENADTRAGWALGEGWMH